MRVHFRVPACREKGACRGKPCERLYCWKVAPLKCLCASQGEEGQGAGGGQLPGSPETVVILLELPRWPFAGKMMEFRCGRVGRACVGDVLCAFSCICE